jgi:hypothetical protein
LRGGNGETRPGAREACSFPQAQKERNESGPYRIGQKLVKNSRLLSVSGVEEQQTVEFVENSPVRAAPDSTGICSGARAETDGVP